MSEFQRLKEMVAKLRAKEPSVGERRTLRGSDAAERLASLVAEINETILPRRLIFQWDDGPGIQLAVANRRLQGVLAPSVDALMPHAGKPLSAPEDSVTEAVRTALLAALETASSATIRSRHLGNDDLGSDAGISAEALVRRWALADPSEDKSAPQDSTPAFLGGLGGIATAWLSVEGEEIAAQEGPSEEVSRLGDTAAYVLDAYLNRKEALFGTEEVPRCYAVSGHDRAIFFGDTGSQTIFVLSEPDNMARVAGLWRKSFG